MFEGRLTDPLSPLGFESDTLCKEMLFPPKEFAAMRFQVEMN